MRRINKKLIAIVLTVAMVLTMGAGMNLQSANAADLELHNPVVEMNTCETVYFGNYWQEDTNGDGVADRNDDKTPIRWRILSRKGNDAYVMADQILDWKPYHEKNESVTWKTSTLRKWLNEEFYNTAFTSAEQGAVLGQTLVNEDNEEYGIDGGEDTVDRVYLPSMTDMINEDYGFSGDYDFRDQARIGKVTSYAEERGANANDERSDNWWLRSPVLLSGYFISNDVLVYGNVNSYGQAVFVNQGIRPVLHLNLSSLLVQQGDPRTVSLGHATWDLVKLGTYAGKAITWRVLSISGNDVFLLSDQVLADREYHEMKEESTWKDSTLRAWLNGDFYQEAFTEEEKAGIRPHLYKNEDNHWNGAKGGKDTTDSISLLSLGDIINPAYGFPTDYNCGHQARGANGSSTWWWLRSPANSEYYYYAVPVLNDGSVPPDAVLAPGSDGLLDLGVRPALHFDLSVHPLTKVGTITAEAEEEYRENVPAATDESGNSEATSVPETTAKPSKQPSSTPVPEETLGPKYTPEPEETQEPKYTPEPEETQEPEYTQEPEKTELPDRDDDKDLTDDQPNRNLTVKGLDIATGNVVKIGFLTLPQVQLTWDANRNCDGYEIWRKAGNSSFVKVDYIDDSDETEWFDTNLKKGYKYTYQVLGYREEDDGTVSRAEDSNSVSVKIWQTVKSCTYTAKRTGKKLKIIFKKAEGTKYQIQVKYGKSQKWKKASGSLKKKIVKKVSPKKLKVRIRTGEKVNGKMKYCKWSKVKTVR